MPLLNLSRKLHFKAPSGNYHPALPTAAFLTWDTASCMSISRSNSTEVLFHLPAMLALLLHQDDA